MVDESIIKDLDLAQRIVEVGKRMAWGGYSEIMKGRMIVDGESIEVAIKALRIRQYSNDSVIEERLRKRFYREISLWRKLKHVNVVPLLGYTLLPDEMPTLVSPWYINGNVVEYIRSNPNADRHSLATDAVMGLEYLHTLPVAHGDLKGENVLVNASGRASLCDFGMSQFIDEASCISGFTTTNAYAGGTDRYMAPELFQDQPKTAATDIWALGCLVVQIFSDRIPYQHITRRHAIPPVIIRGELPVSNDNGDIDPPLWNCLSKCFNVDPSLRPGAHEVRRHLSDRGTMEKSFISPVTLRSDSNSDDPEPSTSSSPVLPTMAALMDMDPEQVPPELKKEGSDWFAIFNPQAKRALDISLSLSLAHESVVCCVRFSADGKYLATGCNRTAQIYDTKTGAKTCTLADESASKHGDLYIRSVCFSPDGKYLATGAEDKQIRMWDIAKRKLRAVFKGHQQEIYSLDWSRDGSKIVSGSGDKTVRIWDMEIHSSKVLQILEPESEDAGVTSVAISPDGNYVAAGSLDTVVRIWDVRDETLVDRLRGHSDCVYSVAFTPDGKALVSGSLDKTLKYWDLTPMLKGAGSKGDNSIKPTNLTGKTDIKSDPTSKGKKEGGEKGSACTVGFTGHKDYVLSVAVSPDGAWVVSGSKDRGVRFWDPRTSQTQLMLQGHKYPVISIDLSPAGGLLATGSRDWIARVWSYTPVP